MGKNLNGVLSWTVMQPKLVQSYCCPGPGQSLKLGSWSRYLPILLNVGTHASHDLGSYLVIFGVEIQMLPVVKKITMPE